MQSEASNLPAAAPPAREGGPERDQRGNARHRMRVPRKFRWLLLLALAALLVRTFVGEASVVPTGSMEGTILVGDHLLVNKLLYGPEIPWLGIRLPRLKSVGRGEIVAFRSPTDPKLTYLKRVVALGGDRVEIRAGLLYVNSHLVPEPYVQHRGSRAVRESIRPRRVPAGHMFVLGDNRDRSSDSRDFGSVRVDSVLGEPMLVYWSYAAPSEQWLDRNPGHRIRFYASVLANFFSRTRWSRTGLLL